MSIQTYIRPYAKWYGTAVILFPLIQYIFFRGESSKIHKFSLFEHLWVEAEVLHFQVKVNLYGG